MSVRIIGPRERTPPDAIDTTSRSRTWSRGCSPFFLGPIELYGGRVAQNMENAWQYAKVYAGHVQDDEILPHYWEWAEEGWNNPKAVRYPMPRGIKPLFSLWNGERLSYIEARKKIYVPLYGKAVARTKAFQQLQEIYETFGDITLWDFDGYDYQAMNRTLEEVMLDPERKMGHAFVLAMLLEGEFDRLIS